MLTNKQEEKAVVLNFPIRENLASNPAALVLQLIQLIAEATWSQTKLRLLNQHICKH